jgi:hypothetical protein
MNWLAGFADRALGFDWSELAQLDDLGGRA